MNLQSPLESTAHRNILCVCTFESIIMSACYIVSVLIHLSKGQLSKEHFVPWTLVQEEFCPRKHWSKETFVKGESFKHLGLFILFLSFYHQSIL